MLAKRVHGDAEGRMIISMKIEFEKNMQIASELLSYCHLKGASEYHIDMSVAGGETFFVITASPADVSCEEMEQLHRKLDVPRQREMEQDFWELGGLSETASELLLIGMMVDDADVSLFDRVLTIKLKRKA